MKKKSRKTFILILFTFQHLYYCTSFSETDSNSQIHYITSKTKYLSTDSRPLTIIQKDSEKLVYRDGSVPDCHYGYHYTWMDISRRRGKCIQDPMTSCERYDYKFGLCKKCREGYMRIKGAKFNHLCVNNSYSGWFWFWIGII